MDRVRFGRALGYGARHAAKSLAKAADAAASPNPRATTRAAAPAERTQPAAPMAQPAGPIAHQDSQRNAGQKQAGALASHDAGSAAQRMARARAGVAHGSAQASHLRRTIWSPLASFTGVVGLQVSGTFFAVLAAFLSEGLWKDRGMLRLGEHSAAAQKYGLHAVAFVLFTYFAVSSFVRAHLKQRRDRT